MTDVSDRPLPGSRSGPGCDAAGPAVWVGAAELPDLGVAEVRSWVRSHPQLPLRRAVETAASGASAAVVTDAPVVWAQAVARFAGRPLRGGAGAPAVALLGADPLLPRLVAGDVGGSAAVGSPAAVAAVVEAVAEAVGVREVPQVLGGPWSLCDGDTAVVLCSGDQGGALLAGWVAAGGAVGALVIGGAEVPLVVVRPGGRAAGEAVARRLAAGDVVGRQRRALAGVVGRRRAEAGLGLEVVR